MASHVVHEVVGADDGFDLDSGPVSLDAATEQKELPGWLDADSISPVLARDAALVVRMCDIEKAIASNIDNTSVAASRCGAVRRAIFAPPVAALRRVDVDRRGGVVPRLVKRRGALARGPPEPRHGRRRQRRRR